MSPADAALPAFVVVAAEAIIASDLAEALVSRQPGAAVHLAPNWEEGVRRLVVLETCRAMILVDPPAPGRPGAPDYDRIATALLERDAVLILIGADRVPELPDGLSVGLLAVPYDEAALHDLLQAARA
jgi:hypothetical protein